MVVDVVTLGAVLVAEDDERVVLSVVVDVEEGPVRLESEGAVVAVLVASDAPSVEWVKKAVVAGVRAEVVWEVGGDRLRTLAAMPPPTRRSPRPSIRAAVVRRSVPAMVGLA